MELHFALLLIAGGFFAGVVNTIAGGGSMLTVPLLTFAGLPGGFANGTNRVGVLLQNAVAAWGFWREGVPGFRQAAPLLLPISAGALIGAHGIAYLSDVWFERLFAVVILLLLPSTLRNAGGGAGLPQARTLPRFWRDALLFVVGLYGGAIQAGVGLFLMYGLAWSGVDWVRANSIKVVINACFTLLVLPVFVWQGRVDWLYALVLGAGFAAGGWVGPRLVVRGGKRLIRPVLAVAVLALGGKMLWQTF